MAKKVKPYGRQIAGLKDKARQEAGADASAEALAKKAQALADELNWDYTFTADSFASKPKARKVGRPRGKGGRPKATVAANGTVSMADLEAVKGLKDKLGADTLRRLMDVVG
jgi:hypothetical protein